MKSFSMRCVEGVLPSLGLLSDFDGEVLVSLFRVDRSFEADWSLSCLYQCVQTPKSMCGKRGVPGLTYREPTHCNCQCRDNAFL
jgi:hypothetical protein